jgi:Lrp/AsnC family transcriptional regulator, leucine-responsive regulatory protein
MADGGLTLDYYDRELIDLLQSGELMLKQLAAEVPMSDKAVHKRLQRLKAEGVIERFVLKLNPEKVGITHQDLVLLKLKAPKVDSVAALRDVIGRMQEVYLAQEVHDEEFDLLLQVASSGEQHRRANLKLITSSRCVEDSRVLGLGGRRIQEWGLPVFLDGVQ